MIYGNGGVLFYFSRIGMKDMRDGASNVMAVAEQSDFLPRLGEDGRPENMARIIPRLEPCVIAAAGHMVHHEQPERLAREIEAFLQRHCATGPAACGDRL